MAASGAGGISRGFGILPGRERRNIRRKIVSRNRRREFVSLRPVPAF